MAKNSKQIFFFFFLNVINYCGKNKSFPNQVLSSSKMALSLNP